MKKIIIALSLAFALQHNAEAGKKNNKAPQAPEPSAEFKALDKDSDGSLTIAEFSASAKKAKKAEKEFSSKDKNGDGKLSPEEFSAPGKKKKGN